MNSTITLKNTISIKYFVHDTLQQIWTRHEFENPLTNWYYLEFNDLRIKNIVPHLILFRGTEPPLFYLPTLCSSDHRKKTKCKGKDFHQYIAPFANIF